MNADVYDDARAAQSSHSNTRATSSRVFAISDAAIEAIQA